MSEIVKNQTSIVFRLVEHDDGSETLQAFLVSDESHKGPEDDVSPAGAIACHVFDKWMRGDLLREMDQLYGLDLGNVEIMPLTKDGNADNVSSA